MSGEHLDDRSRSPPLSARKAARDGLGPPERELETDSLPVYLCLVVEERNAKLIDFEIPPHAFDLEERPFEVLVGRDAFSAVREDLAEEEVAAVAKPRAVAIREMVECGASRFPSTFRIAELALCLGDTERGLTRAVMCGAGPRDREYFARDRDRTGRITTGEVNLRTAETHAGDSHRVAFVTEEGFRAFVELEGFLGLSEARASRRDVSRCTSFVVAHPQASERGAGPFSRFVGLANEIELKVDVGGVEIAKRDASIVTADRVGRSCRCCRIDGLEVTPSQEEEIGEVVVDVCCQEWQVALEEEISRPEIESAGGLEIIELREDVGAVVFDEGESELIFLGLEDRARPVVECEGGSRVVLAEVDIADVSVDLGRETRFAVREKNLTRRLCDGKCFGVASEVGEDVDLVSLEPSCLNRLVQTAVDGDCLVVGVEGIGVVTRTVVGFGESTETDRLSPRFADVGSGETSRLGDPQRVFDIGANEVVDSFLQPLDHGDVKVSRIRFDEARALVSVLEVQEAFCKVNGGGHVSSVQRARRALRRRE